MPLYELTVITRSLSKPELTKALARVGSTLLDAGAVVEKVESLGHRDLPFKRVAKQTKDPVFASNMFLFHTHMPRTTRQRVQAVLKHDLDTVHIGIVEQLQPRRIECNLDEILKPPAERKAVTELRENQKMGHFTRQIIFKRTEREWRAIPKSYPIAPPRD